jgi:hypothetical protein
MTIVTNTRRRPADDPSTALERNRAEDARLVQRINAAAELHGLSSAGWQDVASGPGLQGTAAGFRRLPYLTPRLIAVAAETAGYGPKGIEAIHDYIYELHEFDDFWSGP